MPQIIEVPGHGAVEFPDGMTDEQIVAAIKRNTPDSDVAALSGIFANGQAQPQPKPQADNSLSRQLGLTLRAGANAVGAIPNMLADPVVRGINALGGSLPIPSQAFERTLSRVLPTPANDAERFANVVSSSMAQPALLAGTVSRAPQVAKALPQLIDNLGTQVVSAAGGGAGSEIARQNDFGPVGQVVAPLVGGIGLPIAGAFAVAGARAAGRGAQSLVAPLTQEGRKNIVARALQSSATNAGDAADNIATAPRYVPGVNPTTAELANDPGVSALYKSARNQNPAAFADVEAANDAARQAMLRQAFGDDATLQAAKAAREAETAPLRNSALESANANTAQIGGLNQQIAQKVQSKASALQNYGQMQTAAAEQQSLADAFTPVPGMPRVPGVLSNNIDRVPEYAQGAQEAAQLAAQRQAERQALEAQLGAIPYKPLQSQPILSSIGSTLNIPGMRASDVVQKTLGAVKDKIAAYTRPDGTIDAHDLYTIRKEVGNTIGAFAKESNNWDKRLTSGLEQGIQRSIDTAIVKSGGTTWPKYLQAYATRSKAIDALQTGQEIAARSLNPVTERLSPAQFARQFANRSEEIAAMPTGADVLGAVNEDLKRSVAPMNVMRASGSDTLQNMVGNDVLQRSIGKIPGGMATKAVSKLLSMLYSPAEQQTRGLLVQSIIDPKLAEELLRRRLAQQPDLMGGLLTSRYPIAQGGLLGSISAQQPFGQDGRNR